ncbi:chitin synthase-domain-containing protein [Cladochytrium replicatum]|nr:chitin synthase-domain-containing protein [Cladochytrium replicatum]
MNRPGRAQKRATQVVSLAALAVTETIGDNITAYRNILPDVPANASTVIPPSTEDVTQNFVARHAKDENYTAIGDRVLVSVNLGITHERFSDNASKAAATHTKATSNGVLGESGAKAQKPPHVFEIVGSAYAHMIRQKEDQSILLLGESGSGKTESHRIVTRNLLDLGKAGKVKSKTQSAILRLETIFAAFGNAHTRANTNASRFGRYSEYQFSEEGHLIGTKMLDYLLEKERLTHCGADEFNFNIFYQLLAGATQEERSELWLTDLAYFHYLNQTRAKYTRHAEDVKALEELRDNLKVLGIGHKSQSGIFRLLSAVLHLGNVTFVDNVKHANDSCSVKNFEVVEQVAELLSVSPDALSQTLTSRTLIVNGETFSFLLKADEAVKQRDAVARTLYARFFSWLVEQTNKKLCRPEEEMANFIAVVEFPGSSGQDAHVHGCHQLLTNYANERLQAFANDQLVSLPQNAFLAEGIDSVPPPMIANYPLLELMGGPLQAGHPNAKPGILNLLDIESSKKQNQRDPDEAVVQWFKDVHGDNTQFATPSKKSVTHQFSIRHFGGLVTYDTHGWIELNSETLNADAVSLVRGTAHQSPSSDAFIRKLFTSVPAIFHPQASENIIAITRSDSIKKKSNKRKSHISHLNSPMVGESGSPSRAGGDSIDVASVKGADTISVHQREEEDIVLIPTVSTDLQTSLSQLLDALSDTRTWFVYHLRPSNYASANSSNLRKIDSAAIHRQVTSFGITGMSVLAGTLYTATIPCEEFLTRYDALLAGNRGLNLKYENTARDKCRKYLIEFKSLGPRYVAVGKSHVFLAEAVWRSLEDSLRRIEDDGEKRGGELNRDVGDEDEEGDDVALGAVRGARGTVKDDEDDAWNDAIKDEELREREKAGGMGVTGDFEKKRLPTAASDGTLVSVDGLDTKEKVVLDMGTGGEAPSAKRKSRWRRDGKKTEDEKRATKEVDEQPMSLQRKQWVCCTWFLTWWIPSYFLRVCGKMTRPDIQMAWREKFALNLLIYFCCVVLLFYIVVLGRIICPKRAVLGQGEVDGKIKINNPYVSMYGDYYKINDIVKTHVTVNEYFNDQAMITEVLGRDVSALFDKTLVWQKYCPMLSKRGGPPSGWTTYYLKEMWPSNDKSIWAQHIKDRTRDYVGEMSYMKKGQIARDAAWVEQYISSDLLRHYVLVAYDKVYDFTGYMQLDSTQKFLGTNMNSIIERVGQTGKDATPFIEQLKTISGEDYAGIRKCMDGFFYYGVVDHRLDAQCVFSNYILLASTIVIVALIGVKFLAAINFGWGTRAPEDFDKFVIIQVPCYTEGAESLAKTFESVALSKYDDRHKLMFVICDGMIIGSGNDRATPRIALDILGVDPFVDPPARSYHALGEGNKQHNMAKIYSGLYEVQGRTMPFVCVVKVGKPSERSKPGNRGKRDSQLVLMRFLSRVHFQAEMSPLDLEMYHNIKNVIGVDPSLYEYVLMVDADTEVLQDGINRLISHCVNDAKLMGICGETVIANDMDSWVTMIQVYEYFISHHIAKAFESMFGTVTCLPGCFCMYRIRTPAKNLPLLISPAVIQDYSENNVDTLHKKNLLHLGEDRYLTTLMLKHFPYMKLTFTPDAKCMTIVPDRWDVLVSQRRRWINSTVHNLVELLALPQLCGFCFFSMRFVIFFDLFATFVQPASLLYIGYLIYTLVTDEEGSIPLVSLIMIGAAYGLQVIVFILKREWQHIAWMIIYLLAMPVFGFYLPLYSFWHFDDFSWGNTRLVVGESGQKVHVGEGEEFDPASVPWKTWKEYEQELLDAAQKEEQDPSKKVYTGTVYGGDRGASVYGGAPGAYAGSVYGGATIAGSVYGGVPVAGSVYGGAQVAGSVYGGAPVAGSVYGGVPPITGSVYGGAPTASVYGGLPPVPSVYAQSLYGGKGAYVGSVYGAGVASSPHLGAIPPAPSAYGGVDLSGYSSSAYGGAPLGRQPTDQELLEEIRRVLAKANLMTVTKKSVREQVGMRFGVDLTSRKDEINAIIDGVLKGGL